MRYGRGIAAMVVAAALVAPVAAFGAGAERSRLADERVAASAMVEGGGSLVSELMERLEALLTLAWDEARGIIVPGAEETSTLTTPTETRGE
jgi:hypothetical protein